VDGIQIFIPGDIDPMERGERFEIPIDRALRKAGRLGRSTGGETAMALSPGGLRVDGCSVFLDVKDVRRAVAPIRDALVAAGAPPGTIVGHPESDTILIHFTNAGPAVVDLALAPLTEPPPRYPWEQGEVLGYRLTADRWVLLLVAWNDRCSAGLRAAQWCGPRLPATAAIPSLLARPASKYVLAKVWLMQLNRLGLTTRTPPPPGLSARRVVRTGVSVAVPEPRPGVPVSHATPRQLDKVLRQVFGLAPVDGVTRLYLDLGLSVHHHLAAWDPAGTRPTPAGARALFYACCGNKWRDPRPKRVAVPTTDATRRFVAALKQRFRGDQPWGWGNFRAAEGFVIVPAVPDRFADVWAAAVELGREHRLAVFDPQCDRLVRPAGN
jgi:hypothetical protein